MIPSHTIAKKNSGPKIFHMTVLWNDAKKLFENNLKEYYKVAWKTFNRLYTHKTCTAQKLKFSINDFFSKRDQICRKLRIWSHLQKKLLIENFICCAVIVKITLKILEGTRTFLIHFTKILPFYTLWRHQKTSLFMINLLTRCFQLE